MGHRNAIMENPQKNKDTARVFARYLKKKYGWNYDVVLPEAKNQPIFDAKLLSSEREELMLQMKQMVQGNVEFMKSKRGQPGMGNPGKDWKAFKNAPLGSLIKDSEEQYGNEAINLILILHIDVSYLMRDDMSLINTNDFQESVFKGIYIVSPERELWKVGVGKRIQGEFVFEIKNAFS